MPDETPADLRTRASELVRKVSEHENRQLSTAEIGVLVDAVEQDLGTVADQAALDEERLARVETQTRVLAEAVLAITETAVSLAPAVQAVRDEM